MKIKCEDKEYKLNEYFNIKDYKNKDKLEIKLIGINNIKSIDSMFKECSLLLSLPDFDKLDTTNITSFSYLFYGCSLIKSLPDISKWNTNNVTNMSWMFDNCSSLINLPDISKWNTNNVTNMSLYVL